MKIPQTVMIFALAATLATPVLADSINDRLRRPPEQVIKNDIRNELQTTYHLDPPDIRARVIAGQVTLEGDVSSFRDRMRIEQVIKGIDGVQHVRNRVQVKRFPDERQGRVNQERGDDASLGTAKRFRGTIAMVAGDELIVRDLRNVPIEMKMTEATAVTLDGKPVDDQVLGADLQVFVVAKPDRGELIAQAVEAYSPR